MLSLSLKVHDKITRQCANRGNAFLWNVLHGHESHPKLRRFSDLSLVLPLSFPEYKLLHWHSTLSTEETETQRCSGEQSKCSLCFKPCQAARLDWFTQAYRSSPEKETFTQNASRPAVNVICVCAPFHLL